MEYIASTWILSTIIAKLVTGFKWDGCVILGGAGTLFLLVAFCLVLELGR